MEENQNTQGPQENPFAKLSPIEKNEIMKTLLAKIPVNGGSVRFNHSIFSEREKSDQLKESEKQLTLLLKTSKITPSGQEYLLQAFRTRYILGTNLTSKESNWNELHLDNSPDGLFGKLARKIEKKLYYEGVSSYLDTRKFTEKLMADPTVEIGPKNESDTGILTKEDLFLAQWKKELGI